ncbi:hypothetical protein QQ045_012777 [Rhodiola kirilowii]
MQGDPLSPYLFILCSEWLSYNLSKLHLDRSMEGIRVSRRAPHITHLMFADDCILLFKLEDSTAETLSYLLRKYENLSGQVINYNKSELVLSPNATDAMKTMFQENLTVKVASHHDRYLGLPLTLKRKLTINFSGVIDKFWNKTQGWKARTLSAGGKEIRIKAVLQAFPQYAMNCFMLPEYVINKMQSIIRGVWWGSSSSKKPIYWTTSHILSRDKDMGGLAFKDLKCINMASLAKPAWRVYTKPELLVSKIYKAKYSHNTDMMQCRLSYRPSFCWRSIYKRMEVIRAGTERDHNGNLKWKSNASGEFDISSAYKFIKQSNGIAHGDDAGCSDYAQRRRFLE